MRVSPLCSVLFLGTMAVLLTGCSRNPVSPEVSLPMGSGAEAFAGTQIEDPPAPFEGGLGATSSVTLAAGEEGKVTAGHFRLVLHKNSLKMAATITLTQSDLNVMEVQVEVSPPEANDFKVPVALVADCSGDPSCDVSKQTMFWWNGGWEQANSVAVHRASNSLTARALRLANGRVGERSQAGAGRSEN